MKWVAVDAQGLVIASLPSLVPGGALRRTVGRYESQTFKLVLADGIDPNWLYATTPMCGALIGYSGEPGQERIEWGGIITRRKRGLGNTVQLAAATPEAYLDRRFTGDYSAVGLDQNEILSQLVAIATTGDPAVAGSDGWPFEVQVIGAPGPARDRAYADTDDKTLYSAIDELSHVEGGPQWVTSWVWDHGPDRIYPVVQVGTRIGTAKTLQSAPVSFSPSMMLEADLDEDYSAGRGANLVRAVSTGFDGTRPQAVTGRLQAHRPVVEDRFTPSTSITDATTLLAHAEARLAGEAEGSQALSFKLAKAAAPVLGVDWSLGDDVDVTITGPAFDTPVTVTGQCIGVELDADTITPYIATEGGFGDAQ